MRIHPPDHPATLTAIVVADALYGDSGKGRVVAHNVKRHGAHTVVKYTGGAQCAHHLVHEDGRSHTFAQFGAGTLHGARTHIGRHFLLNPLNMGKEAGRLAAIGINNPMSLVTIDEDTPIITPFHRATNRLRELFRGDARHGSCGQGVGETASDLVDDPDAILRAGDLRSPDLVRAKLAYWQERKRVLFADSIRNPSPDITSAIAAELAHLIADPNLDLFDSYQRFADDVDIVPGTHLNNILATGVTVFEGAQGVLLDEWYGFHPYTTWSTTGPDNAMTLLAEAGVPRTSIDVQMVMRPYMVRHGVGPFPTECPRLTSWLQDGTNPENKWQGAFRVGHFDAVAARYAINSVERVSGVYVDRVAFTNCDRLVGLEGVQFANTYQTDDAPVNDLPLPVRGDLDAQQALTNMLMGGTYQPTYTPVRTERRSDVERFLEHLSTSVLRKPIAVNTWGPAVTDEGSWITAGV